MIKRHRGFLGCATGVTALLLIATIGASFANDYDFEDFARREGCESVVFNDRRRECSDLQRNVNRYCKEERFDCNLGDFSARSMSTRT